MTDFKVELSKDKVYYLATPYSNKSQDIVEFRYREQQRLLAHLTKELGLLIIAPIEMCHNLSKNYSLPSGYEYWKKRDKKLIDLSDGVVVGLIPGWTESVGVTDEITHARETNKPVYYLNPHTLELFK